MGSLQLAFVLLLGGCSLIVDFDRSQLDDGGADSELDGSLDGGVIPLDEEDDAEPEPGVDAG